MRPQTNPFGHRRKKRVKNVSVSKYINGKLNLDDPRVTEIDCYKELCAVMYLEAHQIVEHYKQESVDAVNTALSNSENTGEFFSHILLSIKNPPIFPPIIQGTAEALMSEDEDRLRELVLSKKPYLEEDEELGLTAENLDAARQRIDIEINHGIDSDRLVPDFNEQAAREDKANVMWALSSVYAREVSIALNSHKQRMDSALSSFSKGGSGSAPPNLLQ